VIAIIVVRMLAYIARRVISIAVSRRARIGYTMRTLPVQAR